MHQNTFLELKMHQNSYYVGVPPQTLLGCYGGAENACLRVSYSYRRVAAIRVSTNLTEEISRRFLGHSRMDL